MANKNLFTSIMGKLLPKADTVNAAGGQAYAFTPKHTLAQYASTGCLNATFYANAEEQLAKVIELCQTLDPKFIAQTAIFARQRGQMKDMPALLCAVLAVRDVKLLEAIFPRVIDNGKMLRTFVQILRSGVVGRKSLGSAPKRLIREWFAARNDEEIFKASIGNDPSFADIVKMIHPTPKTKSREALFGYFIGRDINADALPQLVKSYERFKNGDRAEMPNVPFQMLTSLELSKNEWAQIARTAPWQMTRMNLNTFVRHDVFAQAGMEEIIADRLSDEQAIKKARVFPYQLMTAYTNADQKVPGVVRNALQDAMEIAIGNVPSIKGKVFVCPDVSGSMQSPVTGYRKSATSKVRCIDVAALVAAAILRKNPNAEVIPFSDEVVKASLNPRDSVMTNAQKLANLPSGGTNCSAPLAALNKRKAIGDLVIYVSDNESWMDPNRYGSTTTMKEWAQFKMRNANARMVCIDICPNATTQGKESADVLNIGGFSDQVFDVITEFAKGKLNADHWIGVIEAVSL